MQPDTPKRQPHSGLLSLDSSSRMCYNQKKGGAALDPVVYPVAADSFTFRSCKAPEVTTTPHGASCAGFPFATGVLRCFSAICLICHFKAAVRRFCFGQLSLYSRRYACAVRLVYGLMAWRCPLLRGLPLALTACRLPCDPPAAVDLRRRGLCGCLVGAVRSVRPGAAMACLAAKVAIRVAGKVAKVAGIVVTLCAKVAGIVAQPCAKVAVKVAGVCAKVAHFTQKS